MKFRPIAKQEDAIAFLKARERALLSLCPGYGKSVCSLLAIPEKHGLVIVVCPTIVTLHWKAEVEKWRPSLGRVQIIKGALDMIDPSARVIIITYGVLRNRMKPVGKSMPRPDVLILDEAHAIKTPYLKRKGKTRGQRTGATLKLMKDSRIIFALTGTPILNRPSEIGVLLKAFGVITDHKQFQAVYCGGWQAPWGWVKDGKVNEDGLKALLEPVMFRRPASDLKDVTAGRLPPRVLELDQPVHAREKQFNKAAILKNPNPVAFEGLSELMKLSGIKKVNLCVEHIKDVLEIEPCVVVFVWHTEVAMELERALSSYGVVTITGATKDTSAASVHFQNGNARVAIVSHACGVGVNLFRSSYVIFVESPWNPSILDQCISRCDRVGQTEVVRTDILTVHKSIDAHVLHHILNKDEIIESVITTTFVEGDSMGNEVKFSGLDKSLIRTVEFRAQELGVTLEEWLVGAMYDGGEKPAAEKKAPEKKAPEKKAEKKPEKKPEPTFTLDDVRAEMRKYLNTNGGEATRALLETYDAQKLTDVRVEDYARLIAELKG